MMANDGCVQADGVLKVFAKIFLLVILAQEMQNEIHVFDPFVACSQRKFPSKSKRRSPLFSTMETIQGMANIQLSETAISSKQDDSSNIPMKRHSRKDAPNPLPT
jgi:hypothetical protein